MTPAPVFFYYIASGDQAVTENSPVWQKPLPLNRHLASSPSSRSIMSYGDYFTGVRSFLSGDNYNPVFAGMENLSRESETQKPPEIIRVYLMKHGEYYHPAQIRVETADRFFLFVLNVAVSSAGLSMMNTEIKALNRLARTFPYAYTPRVFTVGDIRLNDRCRLKMFLGEWFEGYKEFHLSFNSQTRQMGIIVWDDEKGASFLPESRIEELYSNAAKILTGYYNISTFEQISSWHHAAGDFILNDSHDKLSVRLVTARNYKPLMENGENDIGTMLDALVIFFLNLSIRMRLDRENGVGDFKWTDDRAAAGTVSGFFEGLDMQCRNNLIPVEFVEALTTYLLSFKPADLLAWATDITDRIHPNAPETTLVRENIRDHIECLHNRLLKYHQSKTG
jgi:hypothetical protein